ncbi:hypothetical protein [Algoriphagus boritolerans]
MEYLGIVKIVTDLGLPTTGLGNNMVIRKKGLSCLWWIREDSIFTDRRP